MVYIRSGVFLWISYARTVGFRAIRKCKTRFMLGMFHVERAHTLRPAYCDKKNIVYVRKLRNYTRIIFDRVRSATNAHCDFHSQLICVREERKNNRAPRSNNIFNARIVVVVIFRTVRFIGPSSLPQSVAVSLSRVKHTAHKYIPTVVALYIYIYMKYDA